MSGAPTISIDYSKLDSGLSNPTTAEQKEVKNAIDKLVKDLNALEQVEYDSMYAKSKQQQSVSHLSSQSSDIWGYAWNTMATDVPNQTCNMMSGGICCISAMMNVISDLTNLMNIANKDFMVASNQAKDNPGGAAPTAALQSFQDAINVFATPCFTVTGAGTSGTYYSLLPVNDNATNSLLCNPDLWEAGVAPMDESSGDLLYTQISSISSSFGSSWGDPNSEWNKIKGWVVPTQDSTTGTYSTTDDVDQVLKYMSESVDQLGTNTQTLQNQLNVATNEMESFIASWSECIDYTQTMGQAEVQGQMQ